MQMIELRIAITCIIISVCFALSAILTLQTRFEKFCTLLAVASAINVLLAMSAIIRHVWSLEFI